MPAAPLELATAAHGTDRQDEAAAPSCRCPDDLAPARGFAAALVVSGAFWGVLALIARASGG